MVPLFLRFGLYRAIFRYAGFSVALAIGRALGVYTLLFAVLVSWVGVPGVPRSVGLIQPLMLLVTVVASRSLARWWLGGLHHSSLGGKDVERVLIYGAGSAGRQLAAGLAAALETTLGAGLAATLGAALGAAAFFATGLLTAEGALPGFAAGLVVVFVTALAGALGTDFEGTAGFFWVDTGDTCPLAALVAVGVVFAVLVAGAFTRCLLSVPVNAWSWGCALPPTGVRGASSHAGCAGCFVVIPRLRSASGLRTARRHEADLAGRWAPDLGRDCNDDGVVGTDMASDRKPRRWRSETNSTFRSDSGGENGRSPTHTSDWSNP